jgi:fumarate reductase subunit D
MAKTSSKPFMWLLFSAGGMLAALFAPALVLLFGIAIPLDLVAQPGHSHMLALLWNGILESLLLVLSVLALFHWAYRFFFVVRDILHIKRRDRVLVMICYASAVAGSTAAGYIILG